MEGASLCPRKLIFFLILRLILVFENNKTNYIREWRVPAYVPRS